MCQSVCLSAAVSQVLIVIAIRAEFRSFKRWQVRKYYLLSMHSIVYSGWKDREIRMRLPMFMYVVCVRIKD